MHEELTLKQEQKVWHGSYRAYFIGFVASLLLTLLSFGLVITRVISNDYLFYVVVALGFTQAVIQLIFFLHAGQEEKPRWGLVVFYFMVLILAIIALGSIWIMHDLNNRVMPPM